MIVDILKAILFGIVEGITEWLPISSTGHMILLEEFVKMDVSEAFWEVFLVVIQLGAIMAVVLLFWDHIWPFDFRGTYRKKALEQGKTPAASPLRKEVFVLWGKILLSCVPAAIVGILLDDWLDAHLYNSVVVSISLIVFGIAFILIENRNQGTEPRIASLSKIDYQTALMIGGFQLIAAIFPGTSRSGATILGALLIGVSRKIAAEYTFFLAIPVMAGASLLKVLKYVANNGVSFTATEWTVLVAGVLTAFVISVIVIRFLLNYIRRHDFKVFGIYRIVLGVIVLAYFAWK